MKDCIHCTHKKWTLVDKVPVMDCPVKNRQFTITESTQLAELCRHYNPELPEVTGFIKY